ncbi:MAG: hypothetical protein HY716_03605 [Planctomycetes bacterium]|nr:hypothetical protein [Planctomycetota bacterium]
MKLARVVMACLLGASVVLNGIALAKLSRGRPSKLVAAAPSDSSTPRTSPRSISVLRGELKAVRARNAELLEQREEALPPAEPAGASAPAPRRPIRFPPAKGKKLFDLFGDLEPYVGLIMFPATNPTRYADLMNGMVDAALEGAGVPLTDEQRRGLERHAEALAAALEAAPMSPAYARQLGELEARKAFLEGLDGLVTPAQRSHLTDRSNAYALLMTLTSTQVNTYSLASAGRSTQQPVSRVLEEWNRALGVGQADLQAPQMQQAADRFVSAVARINEEHLRRYGAYPVPGEVWKENAALLDPAAQAGLLDYQARVLRAQIEALDAISGLSEEQRERLDWRTLNVPYSWESR